MLILLILISFIYASPGRLLIEHGLNEQLTQTLISKQNGFFSMKKINRPEIQAYLKIPKDQFAMLLKEWLKSDLDEHHKLLESFLLSSSISVSHLGHPYKIYGRLGRNGYVITYLTDLGTILDEGETGIIPSLRLYGHGIAYYPSNGYIRYIGNYVNDQYHGYGKLYYENEPIQSEEINNHDFAQDQDNKKGPILYEGEFVGGKMHGEGTVYYENGNVQHKGKNKYGLAEGYGILYYKNGEKEYEGDFSKGYYHGQGTSYFNNEQIQYKGGFSKGTPHGQGTLYYENGKPKFTGMINHGNAHGYCTSYYENGEKQSEGDFSNGNAHGKAKTFYKNGKVKFVGEYENGLPKEGIQNDQEGRMSFIGKFRIDFLY